LGGSQPTPTLDTQGARQSALRFNGLDQHVRIPNFFTNAPTTEVTVEFWQKAFGYRNQSSFSQDDAQRHGFDPTNVFNAHVPYRDQRVYWDFGNIRTEGRLFYAPKTSVLGTWHHFAFVASQRGNFMRVYRNGVLEAEKTGMTPLRGGDFDLIIGGETNVPVSFRGMIDEFRIWKVARSGTEIRAAMDGRLALPQPGLMACWRFDEGEGELARDVSGNGRDGILVNKPQWVVPEFTNQWAGAARQVREQNCDNRMRQLQSAAVSYCLERGLAPDSVISVDDLETYLRPGTIACPSGTEAYPAFSAVQGPSCPNGHALRP
jgi:hypothetical protein